MTQPAIVPGRKPVITLRTALISTLRTWFLYRDEALWAFVGGADPDRPLEDIEISAEVVAHVAEANEAAKRAWTIAEKIASQDKQNAATVMRSAIDELLAAERPGLLLAVDHIPGSF